MQMMQLDGYSAKLESVIISQWLNLSNQGAIAIDQYGNISFINTTAAEHLGVDATTSVGVYSSSLWASVIKPSGPLYWVAKVLRTMGSTIPNTATSNSIHIQVAHANRPVQHLQLNSKFLHSNDGRHYLVIATTDISSSIVQQEALEEHGQGPLTVLGIKIDSKPNQEIRNFEHRFEEMAGGATHQLVKQNTHLLQAETNALEGIQTLQKSTKDDSGDNAHPSNKNEDNAEVISKAPDSNSMISHYVGEKQIQPNQPLADLQLTPITKADKTRKIYSTWGFSPTEDLLIKSVVR